MPPEDLNNLAAEDVPKVFVRGAFTNIATFHDDDGHSSHMLEMRVYTLDGEEHLMFWPIEVAVPLLQPILHLTTAVLGIEVHTPADTPDLVEDIDWGDEG